ncbi:MAG: HPP family protein [Clostridiales bacterium]|nr:HPP family protein [Clostridiales bacterium]
METGSKFYLIDKNFKQNKKQYIIQCAMAAVAISLILVFLSTLFNSAVLAAFGATSFIVFAMPKQKTSNARRLLGGYFVGILVGIGARTLMELVTPAFDILWLVSVFGALAVALSILVMTITNTEHPPAAGVALGIALGGYEFIGIAILALSVSILVFLKFILKRWLIDLM